jgi:hypothetical protein
LPVAIRRPDGEVAVLRSLCACSIAGELRLPWYGDAALPIARARCAPQFPPRRRSQEVGTPSVGMAFATTVRSPPASACFLPALA